MRRVKVFFDGGCRGDRGRLETAVVVAGQATIASDIGFGTSSDAEWLALIHALELARSLALHDIVLLGDSADIVAKANGTLAPRPADQPHLARYHALLAGVGGIKVRRIKRSQNLAGIALAARHVR